MSLVDEKDTDKVDVVCLWDVDFAVVFFKFLDVDDHYLRLSISVANHSVAAEIRHQFFAAVRFADVQATHSKLIGCLLEEVQTVNDEVELYSCLLLGVEVGQVTDIIESKSRFAATLRMPNDSGLYTGF